MKIQERRNQIIAMLYQNMDKVDADETLKLVDNYTTDFAKLCEGNQANSENAKCAIFDVSDTVCCENCGKPLKPIYVCTDCVNDEFYKKQTER